MKTSNLNPDVPDITGKELLERINLHIEELIIATDAAEVSEEMENYLKACALFHHYSARNIWLISMAMPDATRVAGAQTWSRLGRQVRDGEAGIAILAPVPVLVPIRTNKKLPVDHPATEFLSMYRYRVVYVYDVSQTTGKPLPEIPNWKSTERRRDLEEKLALFAHELGIQVSVQALQGNTQGVSLGKKIMIAPDAGTKTLIHEIAHELLHQNKPTTIPKPIAELEAESVAYTVGRYFGIDEIESPNYITLHGATSKMILEHMDHIRDTSEKIILGVKRKRVRVINAQI